MVKKNEVGEVRKAIRRMYAYKNNFDTYKNKISRNLGSKFTPKINKWNKKIGKKTKNKVSISSPFAKQKGGFWINKLALKLGGKRVKRKQKGGFFGFPERKSSMTANDKLNFRAAMRTGVFENAKKMKRYKENRYNPEIMNEIRRMKYGLNQKGGMYRPRRKRENKIPSMEYRYEY